MLILDFFLVLRALSSSDITIIMSSSQFHLTLFSVCTFNPTSIPCIILFCSSHTSPFSFFFSLENRWQVAGTKLSAFFFLLWRFEFVISLMQSRPATCPGHRKPTTELLSLRTKTQSLCFWKNWKEEVEGMGDGREGERQKLNPVQVCVAFMLN